MKFLLLLQNVSHGNESVQLRLGSTLGSLALRTPDQQVSVYQVLFCGHTCMCASVSCPSPTCIVTTIIVILPH